MSLLVPPPPLVPPRPRPTRPREATAHPRRTTGAFALRQALLLCVAVAVYFGVRSLTAGSAPVAERNAELLVDLERSLGVFAELDLQRLALGVDGMVPVVNAIYIWAHWPVIVGVLGWLAWRRRAAFLVYRNALLISGLVGMVIVATFPVAPPRLMDLGFFDTVTAESRAYRVLQPPSFTNQYAAMPSFHVGWDLLMGIALMREAGRRWLRVAGAALPGLMVFTVVVTGNHYFIDAVVGDVIVLGSLWVATAWAARSATRARTDLVRSSGGRPRPQPVGTGDACTDELRGDDHGRTCRDDRPAEAAPAA